MWTFALKLFITLAAFWHTLAFAAGGAVVVMAFAAVCGLKYERWWTRAIRTADQQLWISGVTLIGLGVVASGFAVYAANPKLWAKVVVVATWAASTQFLRRFKQRDERDKLVSACGVNLACWIYGAFLGVAKPLAFGVVSFSAFAAGFAVVCVASVVITKVLYRRSEKRANLPATRAHASPSTMP